MPETNPPAVEVEVVPPDEVLPTLDDYTPDDLYQMEALEELMNLFGDNINPDVSEVDIEAEEVVE